MENINNTWVNVEALTWGEAEKLGLTMHQFELLKEVKNKIVKHTREIKKKKKIKKVKRTKKVINPVEEKKDIEEIQDELEQDWIEADKFNSTFY